MSGTGGFQHPGLCERGAGSADKPVRVYIMSGQSNMVGFGTVAGTGDHTLETMTVRQNKFPDLIDESGAWTTRQDVWYRGVISDITNGRAGTYLLVGDALGRRCRQRQSTARLQDHDP